MLRIVLSTMFWLLYLATSVRIRNKKFIIEFEMPLKRDIIMVSIFSIIYYAICFYPVASLGCFAVVSFTQFFNRRNFATFSAFVVSFLIIICLCFSL